jgi:hypothetical protein
VAATPRGSPQRGPAIPPDPPRGRHANEAGPPADDDGDYTPDRAAARRRIIRLALLALLVAATLGIGLAIVINGSVGNATQSTGRITLPTPGRADDGAPPPVVVEPKISLIPSPQQPGPSAASPAPSSASAPASPFLEADARVVTAGGLGPFRLGALVGPAIRAGAATGGAQGQCGSVSAVLATEPQYQDPGSGRRLSAHITNGRVAYITVWTATHRTKSGLGVGSALSAVVGSSATAEQFGDANAGSVLVKDPNGGAVLFVFRAGAARALVAGPVGALRPLAERAAPNPADLTLFC